MNYFRNFWKGLLPEISTSVNPPYIEERQFEEYEIVTSYNIITLMDIKDLWNYLDIIKPNFMVNEMKKILENKVYDNALDNLNIKRGEVEIKNFYEYLEYSKDGIFNYEYQFYLADYLNKYCRSIDGDEKIVNEVKSFEDFDFAKILDFFKKNEIIEKQSEFLALKDPTQSLELICQNPFVEIKRSNMSKKILHNANVGITIMNDLRKYVPFFPYTYFVADLTSSTKKRKLELKSLHQSKPAIIRQYLNSKKISKLNNRDIFIDLIIQFRIMENILSYFYEYKMSSLNFDNIKYLELDETTFIPIYVNKKGLEFRGFLETKYVLIISDFYDSYFSSKENDFIISSYNSQIEALVANYSLQNFLFDCNNNLKNAKINKNDINQTIKQRTISVKDANLEKLSFCNYQHFYQCKNVENEIDKKKQLGFLGGNVNNIDDIDEIYSYTQDSLDSVYDNIEKCYQINRNYNINKEKYNDLINPPISEYGYIDEIEIDEYKIEKQRKILKDNFFEYSDAINSLINSMDQLFSIFNLVDEKNIIPLMALHYRNSFRLYNLYFDTLTTFLSPFKQNPKQYITNGLYEEYNIFSDISVRFENSKEVIPKILESVSDKTVEVNKIFSAILSLITSFTKFMLPFMKFIDSRPLMLKIIKMINKRGYYFLDFIVVNTVDDSYVRDFINNNEDFIYSILHLMLNLDENDDILISVISFVNENLEFFSTKNGKKVWKKLLSIYDNELSKLNGPYYKESYKNDKIENYMFGYNKLFSDIKDEFYLFIEYYILIYSYLPNEIYSDIVTYSNAKNIPEDFNENISTYRRDLLENKGFADDYEDYKISIINDNKYFFENDKEKGENFENLKSGIKKFANQNEILKEKLQKCKNDKTDLEFENEDLKSKYENLEVEYNELRDKISGIENFNNESAEMLATKYLKDQIDKLSLEIDEKNNIINELRDKDYIKELEEKENQIKNMLDLNDKISNELVETKTLLEKSKGDNDIYEITNKKLQKEKSDLDSKIKSYIENEKQLVYEINSLRSVNKELKDNVNKLNEYKNLVEIKLKDFDKIKEDNKKLNNENELLNASINEIINELDSYRNNYDKLQINFNEINEINKKLKNENSQLLELNIKINEDYTNLVKRHDNLINDYDKISNQYDKLENEKNSLIKEYERIKDEYQRIDDEYELIKNERDFNKEYYEDIIAEYKLDKEYYDDNDKLYRHVKDKYKKIKDEYERIIDEYDITSADFALIEEENKNIKDKLGSLEKELELNIKENEKLRNKYAVLLENFNNNEKKYEEEKKMHLNEIKKIKNQVQFNKKPDFKLGVRKDV